LHAFTPSIKSSSTIDFNEVLRHACITRERNADLDFPAKIIFLFLRFLSMDVTECHARKLVLHRVKNRFFAATTFALRKCRECSLLLTQAFQKKNDFFLLSRTIELEYKHIAKHRPFKANIDILVDGFS
jgi:hypothetical protein